MIIPRLLSRFHNNFTLLTGLSNFLTLLPQYATIQYYAIKILLWKLSAFKTLKTAARKSFSMRNQGETTVKNNADALIFYRAVCAENVTNNPRSDKRNFLRFLEWKRSRNGGLP